MQSVVDQTFKDWELIVVDDASTDNSLWEIEQYKIKHPELPLRTIFLGENIGNCRAFNKALVLTKSDYIIDLAADDILLPERLETGVKNMDEHIDVAVNFSNANYIDASGNFIKTHYPVGPLKRSDIFVPDGDVFEYVIKNYYICSPTMMYRSSFLKAIGGYDESLAYEDFDIKVRLAHKHKFSYSDKILVHKRVLNSSMSQKQYNLGDKQLASTLKVCRKIFNLIITKPQKQALLSRIAYECKQALIHFRWSLFVSFCGLGLKTLLRK